MPSFLELVFTFKARNMDRPLAHAMFRHENYLEASSPSLTLAALDRSGIQVQHAFNLLTVEKTQVHGEKNQWPLRHASLYHSLDVKTGRSVWILLKGNRELSTRFVQATEKNRHLRPDGAKTRERSFVASLQVHLIMLEWCAESWSGYIDQMEEDIARKSADAKVAPVVAMTGLLPLQESFSRRSTLRTQGSRQNTFRTVNQTDPTILTTATSSEQRTPTPQSPTSPNQRHSHNRTLSGFLHRYSGLEQRQQSLSHDSQLDDAETTLDPLEDLEKRFNFTELQRLSLVGDEIDRSIDVLEQNKDVVSQIREQYEMVIASHAFRTLMNEKEYEGEISAFLRRTRSVEREIEGHRRRLQALSRSVDNEKQMV